MPVSSSKEQVIEDRNGPIELDTLSELKHLKERISALERAQADSPDSDCFNLLVFDGYQDRLLAAFVMATGAAACGMKVTMFFTFWATAALRNGGPQFGKKSIVERAFGWMLPASLSRTKLSSLNMCGIGGLLMKREMKKKNVANLDTLLETAAELGVTIRICEMSMELMGIRREEIVEYPHIEYCGVARFVDEAAQANTTIVV